MRLQSRKQYIYDSSQLSFQGDKEIISDTRWTKPINWLNYISKFHRIMRLQRCTACLPSNALVEVLKELASICLQKYMPNGYEVYSQPSSVSCEWPEHI